MFGEKFDLMDDLAILRIKSPKKRVKGPFRIIYKDLTKRWVIVSLNWDNKSRLGIRWFYGGNGSPSSRSFATWFILPEEISLSLAISLNLSESDIEYLKTFLKKE